MYKTLLFFAFLALASCSKKEETKPSFLFVILSNHGEIKKAPDGSYELILDHGEIEKVLAFSDRPYRLVQRIDGKKFMELWAQGSNSFEKDPPNASIIIDDHVQTIVLLKVRVEGSRTLFTIRTDDQSQMKEMSGKTQLFIDGAPSGTCPPEMRAYWANIDGHTGWQCGP